MMALPRSSSLVLQSQHLLPALPCSTSRGTKWRRNQNLALRRQAQLGRNSGRVLVASPRGAASGSGALGQPEPMEASEPEPREPSGNRLVDPRMGRPTLRSVARALQAAVDKRVRRVRRWLFLKLLILLLGFFFANALSTVVGQTGDWDVLVAGFLVAVIESIGLVVHRAPRTQLWEKAPRALADALDMVNYFKCGLIFGLFVDCFKVGS